ncbi:MAG: ATP-binding cassette domain-containing protein, partial [Treponema sp.]|nr:ATP-binding cassette domain-containing protein [Treponema sp.]
MRELCLSVRNLSFYYAEGEGTAKAALNDVSFEVKKGEYLAVLGANGSGKSTLLNCINGLLTPKAGAVTVYDRDGLARDPALAGDLNAIRRSAGSVMQNPDNQIVASVVEEDAAFGPSNLGLDEAEIRRRVDNALALTGLLDKREKPPEFLSGGEKQRLALAGALAMDCDCLILDEAASMLDPAAREKLYDILDALIEQGKTILLVTHSFEEAFRCNRALVLSDGGLVFDGKPPELLAHADLEAWGFRLSESAR